MKTTATILLLSILTAIAATPQPAQATESGLYFALYVEAPQAAWFEYWADATPDMNPADPYWPEYWRAFTNAYGYCASGYYYSYNISNDPNEIVIIDDYPDTMYLTGLLTEAGGTLTTEPGGAATESPTVDGLWDGWTSCARDLISAGSLGYQWVVIDPCDF